MTNLTSVGVTAGVPTTGTGTVSTIDNIPALWDKGSGTSGSLTQRVILDSSQIGSLGPQTSSSSVSVVPSSSGFSSTMIDQYTKYNTVAASQTAQALTGGSGGATGDYLAGVLVFPGTAGCGIVTILDNATTVGTFAGGGTTALPSLVPFMIPVGAVSSSGAWKITTGANVTVIAVGKFT
jgi:hypothetical protein